MQVLLLLASVVALASATPRLDGRIVGGVDVRIEDYPYQVSLRRNGFHGCGGSIINENWVVTAAHCTDGMSASSLAVRVGSSLMNGGEEIKVERIFQHPGFDFSTVDNDISLLKLSNSLTFSDSVRPIKYATKRPADGATLTVTGWGATREGGSLSNTLQGVDVNVVNQSTCKDLYWGYDITDRMICAGVDGGKKDSCQGDSGGPLAFNGELVGIVSWGYGCARPQYPGVYASVADLSGYIDETLAQYS